MKLNISNEEYHSRPEISKSKLDLINKSELHYLNPIAEQKDNLDFGSAVHDAVLLPELFKTKYVIIPDSIKVRRGKEWDAFCFENQGKIHLYKDTYQDVLTCRDRIMDDPLTGKIFINGEPEIAYISELEGMPVRCKPDYFSKSVGIDLKTTVCAEYSAFQRSIFRYRYYVQAAFYLDIVSKVLGTEIKDFIFVAIESKPPFAIGIYLLDQESIDLGRKHYKADLEKIRNIKKDIKYTGYSQGKLQVIGVPQYAFYEEMN